MRGLLLAAFLLTSYLPSFSQPYGNEWINPTRTYYKVFVISDGIYRIPYSTLAANIPNLSSLNSQNLILYHNGLAVPIYVSTSSTFSSSDYIEFYGKHNTGDMDSLLYRSASEQINPYFSLYNDSSVYYLSTNNLTTNPRYTVVQNNLNNLPPAENYFMATSIYNYPCGAFYPGKIYLVGTDEVFSSLYDDGEGFANCNFFGDGNPQSFPVPTPSVYSSGPNATLIANYCNNSPTDNHSVTIQVNGNSAYSQSHYGFQHIIVNQSIPVSDLTSGTSNVVFNASDNAVSVTQNMVGSVGIIYPHDFNFGGANEFYFQEAASSSTKYLSIQNFNSMGTTPILYDITNGLIYYAGPPAGSTPVQYQILQSGVNREMYIRADTSLTYNTVTSLTPVNFIDYTQATNQGQYYIISNSLLFNDGQGNNWVDQYRKYRDINENPGVGKYYNVRIANIDLLYDQFGYGIRKSPLAIRNFIRYATSQWSDTLKYVFLIGKSREYEDCRADPVSNAQCLVPTFGSPASDNLLAANRESDFPLVSIGRLPAQTGLQVEAYLNKIKQYELAQNTYAYNQDIPDKIWQKQLLHFSGGTGATEQQTFQNYLASYAAIAQDTSWGCNTTSFSKTSDAPIDQTESQIISNDINNGVTWITFFGHSSTGEFDFSIDEPENYTNYGKFPIILSNGCFSGDINEATPGYSERFVLEANIGSIAFLATSNVAVSDGLDGFTSQLYQNFCRKTYDQPLGVSLKQTLSNLYTCCSANEDDILTSYEMTLDGDPGLFVNEYPKPDYAIDQTSLFFTPSTVTASSDSFLVNLVITNLGKAVHDTFTVTLSRTITDALGNPLPPYVYQKVVVGPFYRDTVSWNLPTTIGGNGYGENSFSPYVDAFDQVSEMAKGNNGLISPVQIDIQSDDIIPIYPYEFAIVPQQGVTLKASTINPFAPLRTYLFEIDTTQLFNSHLMQSGTVRQIGGVVHWKPNITLKDSVVYYWRVEKDTAGANWHYSSFIYLKNEFPGWNQSHFFQWQQDNYFNLVLDSTSRSFKFPPTLNQIGVTTGYADAEGGNLPFETLGWSYNNAQLSTFDMGGCGFNGGITFAVINPLTGQDWQSFNLNGDNYGDKFGNWSCSNEYYEQDAFDFSTSGTNGLYNIPWSQVIARFIDSIPCNYYVLIFSDNIVPYTSWNSQLVTALQSLGFQAQLFQNGTIKGPFVYFTQKCNSNYNPFFTYVNGGFNGPNYAIIDTTFSFSAPWNQGYFITPAIGPAESWGSVHWKHNTVTGDRDTLDIIGEKSSGVDTVLISTVRPDNIITSVVNAKTFPYLKLRYRTLNDTLRTPSQPQYLRVLYKTPPEAAVNPAAHFVLTDTVDIGSNMHVEVALENVTNIPMDSMLTKYTIRDATLINHISYVRYGPLTPLDTMIMKFDAPINSNPYIGLNQLTIEANPNNDQPEQYHFNNFAVVNFHGAGNTTNPTLDVTFDNQHIMNNDLVSAKPDILISLKSNNKYLPLNDTNEISVYLQTPTSTTPVKVNYDGVTLKFFPADSNNLSTGNKAQSEFKPTLPVDGTYELIIKDMDRSGNNSSSTSDRYQGTLFYDYRIDFQVINKPMISNILNYPNPFSTSTRFVFTITGSQLPSNLKIQIMTIKGNIVKEITEGELGPLHIGTNITDYAWDGRDQFGQLLANGVYFYRVTARLNNQEMNNYSESYDNYFNKGFGKMVIVR